MLMATVVTDLSTAILQGMPPGTVYALVTNGFVLTYKTSGVFNLAFGAQAHLSAVLYYKTHDPARSTLVRRPRSVASGAPAPPPGARRVPPAAGSPGGYRRPAGGRPAPV